MCFPLASSWPMTPAEFVSTMKPNWLYRRRLFGHFFWIFELHIKSGAVHSTHFPSPMIIDNFKFTNASSSQLKIWQWIATLPNKHLEFVSLFGTFHTLKRITQDFHATITVPWKDGWKSYSWCNLIHIFFPDVSYIQSSVNMIVFSSFMHIFYKKIKWLFCFRL